MIFIIFHGTLIEWASIDIVISAHLSSENHTRVEDFGDVGSLLALNHHVEDAFIVPIYQRLATLAGCLTHVAKGE